MTKWKNITSYIQGEDSRMTPPRTFEIRVGRMRVILTRHRDFGQEWTIRSPDLGIPSNLGLGTNNEAKAKALCITEAMTACKNNIDELNAMLHTLEELA